MVGCSAVVLWWGVGGSRRVVHRAALGCGGMVCRRIVVQSWVWGGGVCRRVVVQGCSAELGVGWGSTVEKHWCRAEWRGGDGVCRRVVVQS